MTREEACQGVQKRKDQSAQPHKSSGHAVCAPPDDGEKDEPGENDGTDGKKRPGQTAGKGHIADDADDDAYQKQQGKGGGKDGLQGARAAFGGAVRVDQGVVNAGVGICAAGGVGLATQKLAGGDAENVGKRQKQRHIGVAQPALPFGNRFVGDVQPGGQLLLRHLSGFAELGDQPACLDRKSVV